MEMASLTSKYVDHTQGVSAPSLPGGLAGGLCVHLQRVSLQQHMMSVHGSA